MNRIPDSDGQTSTKTDRTKGPFFPLQKKNGKKSIMDILQVRVFIMVYIFLLPL